MIRWRRANGTGALHRRPSSKLQLISSLTLAKFRDRRQRTSELLLRRLQFVEAGKKSGKWRWLQIGATPALLNSDRAAGRAKCPRHRRCCRAVILADFWIMPPPSRPQLSVPRRGVDQFPADIYQIPSVSPLAGQRLTTRCTLSAPIQRSNTPSGDHGRCV